MDPTRQPDQARSNPVRPNIDGIRHTGYATAAPVLRPAPQQAPTVPRPPVPREIPAGAVAPRQRLRHRPAPQHNQEQSYVAPAPRHRGRLITFFKTMLVLVIILAVAVGIVVLYLKYYQ